MPNLGNFPLLAYDPGGPADPEDAPGQADEQAEQLPEPVDHVKEVVLLGPDRVRDEGAAVRNNIFTKLGVQLRVTMGRAGNPVGVFLKTILLIPNMAHLVVPKSYLLKNLAGNLCHQLFWES